MKKLVAGVAAFIITLFAGIAFYVVNQQASTPSPNSPVSSVENISDAAAAHAIANKLSETGTTYSDADIAINTNRTVDETWLIVNATIATLPEEDEGRTMTYVLEVIDSKPVVIAYSGDSFSDNAFPEGTPQTIIDEANRYE